MFAKKSSLKLSNSLSFSYLRRSFSIFFSSVISLDVFIKTSLLSSYTLLVAIQNHFSFLLLNLPTVLTTYPVFLACLNFSFNSSMSSGCTILYHDFPSKSSTDQLRLVFHPTFIFLK